MSSWIVTLRLAAVLLLAPVWALSGAPPAPAPAPAAAPPGFEVVVSEALLAAMVSAVMPYETVMEQEIGGLGFTRTVQVEVKLSNPRTRVTKEGVKVTLDYALVSDAPLVSRTGTATPTLALTPVPARKVIEGRLVRSGVMLPGGIELPLDELVEPLEIPAVIPQEIEAGDKKILAEARMNEVLLEDGRIRIRGDAGFKPAPPVAPAPK